MSLLELGQGGQAMLTLMIMGMVGWQQPPTITPPASKPQMDRRVPPPIPQPPNATPPTPNEQPPVAQQETPASIQSAPAPVRVVPHIFLQQHDINRDGRLSPGELER